MISGDPFTFALVCISQLSYELLKEEVLGISTSFGETAEQVEDKFRTIITQGAKIEVKRTITCGVVPSRGYQVLTVRCGWFSGNPKETLSVCVCAEQSATSQSDECFTSC